MALEYAISRDLDCDFEAAVERIKTLAPEHKLGVVFEIDVQNTIKTKLNEDFRPYKILGLCNPKIAKDILDIDGDFGALLPCAVAVQANEDGSSRVSFYNLPAIVDVIDNPQMAAWNAVVKEKLADFLNAFIFWGDGCDCGDWNRLSGYSAD